jgi:hypothetical protein
MSLYWHGPFTEQKCITFSTLLQNVILSSVIRLNVAAPIFLDPELLFIRDGDGHSALDRAALTNRLPAAQVSLFKTL